MAEILLNTKSFWRVKKYSCKILQKLVQNLKNIFQKIWQGFGRKLIKLAEDIRQS